MPSPIPRLPTRPSWRTCAGGVTSLLLQITAPGQAGLLLRRRGAGGRRCEGVFLDACTVALDARENTIDAAGSLIEIWRERGIGENLRRGAFNYDPLGVLATTGTLYYPAAALLRDRRQVRRRLPRR